MSFLTGIINSTREKINSPNLRFDTIVEVQREINASKEEDSEEESIEIVVSIGTGNQPIVKSRAADAIWPSSVLDAYKSISGKFRRKIQRLKCF